MFLKKKPTLVICILDKLFSNKKESSSKMLVVKKYLYSFEKIATHLFVKEILVYILYNDLLLNKKKLSSYLLIEKKRSINQLILLILFINPSIQKRTLAILEFK